MKHCKRQCFSLKTGDFAPVHKPTFKQDPLACHVARVGKGVSRIELGVALSEQRQETL